MGLTFRKINADDFPLCADILVSAYKGAPWYNSWTKEEAQNNLEKLVELTNSNEKLKYLSQGLFESEVDLDEIVLIIEYFNRTGNFKIDVVKQQLEGMKQKSETETGISEFGVYFIQGYKRIKSNKVQPIHDLENQFYEKMRIIEESPNIPMYNWLNNN